MVNHKEPKPKPETLTKLVKAKESVKAKETGRATHVAEKGISSTVARRPQDPAWKMWYVMDVEENDTTRANAAPRTHNCRDNEGVGTLSVVAGSQEKERAEKEKASQKENERDCTSSTSWMDLHCCGFEPFMGRILFKLVPKASWPRWSCSRAVDNYFEERGHNSPCF